jgi:hypothetical protein
VRVYLSQLAPCFIRSFMTTYSIEFVSNMFTERLSSILSHVAPASSGLDTMYGLVVSFSLSLTSLSFPSDTSASNGNLTIL